MEAYRPHRSWFSRNWPWVVPVGGCLTLIILLIIFVGSVFFGISKAFTGSDAYQEGLDKAQQDEYVKELLGEPIETDGVMQGSISLENDAGNADISIPIKGSKGAAKIYVVGIKNQGVWSYSKMYVIVENNQESIDLLWGAGKIEEDNDTEF